jgi:hypothetical protein
MEMLETALAFSLVMTIFSTMVTAILEIVYRLLASRERLFVLTMERLFDQIIWPVVQQRLIEKSMEEMRTAFIQALTVNPVAEIEQKRRKWKDFGASKRLSGMNVMEFIERLGSTEIGKAIAAEGEVRMTAIVNDMSQKFDRFAKGAHDRLTQRSLGYSLWISFGLAFLLNIDAVNIFNFYMTNHKAREQIVAQRVQIENDVHFEQQRLEAQKASDSARAAVTVKADAEEELQQIEKRIDGLKEKIAALQSDGLPLGYDHFPGCAWQIRSGSVADGRCNVKDVNGDAGAWDGIWYNLENDTVAVLFWFASVLLGGLLVGLGAPFWFSVARGLSSALQVLKALKGSSSAKGSEGGIAEGNFPFVASPGESPPPRTPVEAFTTAIAAAPRSSGARLLLASDGTIGGQ